MKLLLTICASFLYVTSIQVVQKTEETKYEPHWDSLDTRPLPPWFDEAKIGIFLHWGVFSVPSFGSEWFWNAWQSNYSDYVDFMKKNYPERFTYQEFAKDFTAEFFDPEEWAELFKKAGAKYVVLTSKHHEGYAMWPSKYSFGWNSMDVGPHRDLIGDLSTAVREAGLEFGLYHSLLEWYNPMYLSDKSQLFLKQEFTNNKMLPEMYELINNYKPSVLWSDGDWESFDFYFKSREFLAWLYNDSPVKDKIVVNDRWGIGIPCKHGDFFSCKDKYNPGVLQNHKWENAMTLDAVSWGYRRNAKISDYLTTHDLLKTMAETISCGGNLLMNIGPTKEGTIDPIFQERLTQIGEWLAINGDAIYASSPWTSQNDSLNSDVWYTKKDTKVFAIVLNWPENNVLKVESAAKLFNSNDVRVNLLGNEGKLKWSLDNGIVNIAFPDRAAVKSERVWVVQISPPSRRI